MRLLKGLLWLIVLLGAAFVAGGLLLPDRAEVERSIVIERPPAQVFELLDGFARFNEWSPWRDYDPTAAYELAGPARGVGAMLRWRGERGAGSQEIIALDPPHSIAVRLDFGMQGKPTAAWLLRPAGEGTRLVWRFENDAEGAWSGRWFNLLLDRFVGADYERGLLALKALAEAEPAAAPPPPVDGAPQEPLSAEEAEGGDPAPDEAPPQG